MPKKIKKNTVFWASKVIFHNFFMLVGTQMKFFHVWLYKWKLTIAFEHLLLHFEFRKLRFYKFPFFYQKIQCTFLKCFFVCEKILNTNILFQICMTKHIYYLILNQKIHFCCNENMRKCPPADALCNRALFDPYNFVPCGTTA